MADRYWVGGTNTWNTTAGTKWSTTDGGPGGASVPTSADDVFFTALSGTVTVTISTNSGAKSINCTGFTGTIAGSTAITVSGSVTLSASMGLTYTGNISIDNDGTITSNGKQISRLLISGAGKNIQLGDALYISNTFSITTGNFFTNGYSLSTPSFASNNANVRSISLGASNIIVLNAVAIDFQTSTNLTLDAGTSTFTLINTNASIYANAQQIGFTFYNVSFTSLSVGGSCLIRGAHSFNNITFNSPSFTGYRTLNLEGRTIINGTLNVPGSSGQANQRVLIRGYTDFVSTPLIINSSPNLVDVDFRDIDCSGSAAVVSGTRIGNIGNNLNIDFTPPKTVYWRTFFGGSISGNNYSSTPTGAISLSDYPLAQDTIQFPNSGSGGPNIGVTITFDTLAPYVGGINSLSRTEYLIFSIASTSNFSGDFAIGSGVLISGSGTAFLLGPGDQTIYSSGVAFPSTFNITCSKTSGRMLLGDALIQCNIVSMLLGEFDTQNFNLTCNSFTSQFARLRTIRFGSSTITLTGSNALTITADSGLYFYPGTSQININPTASTTLNIGVLSYNHIVILPSIYTVTINGRGTISTITVQQPSIGQISTLQYASNSTIGTLNINSNDPRARILFQSNIPGTSRKLNVTTLNAANCDIGSIEIAGAAVNTSVSGGGNLGNNVGIVFPTAKTVYWNSSGTKNWSEDNYAASSGGAVGLANFPLAQDTLIFDDVGGFGTLSINNKYYIGSIDFSARTSAGTISIGTGNTLSVFGNWTSGAGLTITSSGNNPIIFTGYGTQTITSNGITFGTQITVKTYGTVELGDALSISAGRTFSMELGVFKTNSFSFSLGTFSAPLSGVRSVNFGSSLVTILDAGTSWNIANTSSFEFHSGSSEILLADNTTTSRLFIGGGFYYNKVTIGGTSSNSTTTISGTNFFGELASTKTVAHTISFANQTQTFGKWTVSGSVGNVVTITSPGTNHVINGPAVTGVDYLALGAMTISLASPGEFYAGPNSTGTGNIARTNAPASRTLYWVGGSANWNTTSRWSLISGVPQTNPAPTSLDHVIFNSASFNSSYTVTNSLTECARMASITVSAPSSGNITIAGTNQFAFHGDVTISSFGVTLSSTGLWTLAGSGSRSCSIGASLSGSLQAVSPEANWTLGSNLTSSTDIRIYASTFNTGNYSVTASGISSSTGVQIEKMSINLGSSSIIFSGATPFSMQALNGGNKTLNAGTSTITCTNAGTTFRATGGTLYNVIFSTTITGTHLLVGTTTFNDLVINGPSSAGIKLLNLSGNLVVNGTLLVYGATASANRTVIASNTRETQRTLSCNAAAIQDVDFIDIQLTGAAAPASGTRIGDGKNNSGIIFDAAKTVYFVGTGSANFGSNNWSSSSGGPADPSMFPLAQDTAVINDSFPSAGSTITFNESYNIGTLNMSARSTNSLFLQISSSQIALRVYGDWLFGTAVGSSITANLGSITFAGQNTQTITSNGQYFLMAVNIQSVGGTVYLADNAKFSGTLTLTKGGFNDNGYDVLLSNTAASVGFNSSNSNTRALNASGNWTINGSSTVFNISNSLGLSGAMTGTLSFTNASAKTLQYSPTSFASPDFDTSDLTIDQNGFGTLALFASCIIKRLTNSYASFGTTTISLGNNVIAFTESVDVSGSENKLLNIFGSTIAYILYTGVGTPFTGTYVRIANLFASSSPSAFAIDDTSTVLSGTNWVLAAPTPSGSAGAFLIFMPL